VERPSTDVDAESSVTHQSPVLSEVAPHEPVSDDWYTGEVVALRQMSVAAPGVILLLGAGLAVLAGIRRAAGRLSGPGGS
jgi:hypothetical protein